MDTKSNEVVLMCKYSEGLYPKLGLKFHLNKAVVTKEQFEALTKDPAFQRLYPSEIAEFGKLNVRPPEPVKVVVEGGTTADNEPAGESRKGRK